MRLTVNKHSKMSINITILFIILAFFTRRIQNVETIETLTTKVSDLDTKITEVDSKATTTNLNINAVASKVLTNIMDISNQVSKHDLYVNFNDARVTGLETKVSTAETDIEAL